MESEVFIIAKIQQTKTLSGICQDIDEILKDTFGCIIYQEQVMEIVHTVFKMSMGKADMVRRAIGKKDPELMAKMMKELKAVDTGLPPESVEKILRTIEECSSYLFNKSHSSAYAYTAYQTAYLKTFYPKEFYCAMLNSDIKPEKVRDYLNEAKTSGIPILPPSALAGNKKWQIEKDGLRYGLNKILNVGNCEINPITEQVSQEGDILRAFCKANPDLNKQVIVSMAKAGCFECSTEWAIMYVEWFKKAYKRRQEISDRLMKFTGNQKKIQEWTAKLGEIPHEPNYFETSLEAEIEFQKEVLGFSFLSKLSLYDISLTDRSKDIIAGEVLYVQGGKTRKGDPMLKLDIDTGKQKEGFIIFGDGADAKVAIGDVVLVKKDRSPWHKGGDRIFAREVMKAKRK